MITADRTKTIPIPEKTVNVSEKHMIPTNVATTGSMVAIIPALLASTLRSPSVYARNGITAVTRAVNMQKIISPVRSSVFSNLNSMSAGLQITHEPTAAIRKVYVVTEYGEYFRSATVPSMLYNPYPIPEPSPSSKPVKVIPSPEIPDTSTHPPNARSNAINFLLFIFSRKNSTDISMIQIGEVYKRIAAADKDMIVIAAK